MRAWAAGVIVLVGSEYLQIALVYQHVTGPAGPASFGGRLLLVDLPNAVCVALATWAAARLHREPFRRSTARHLTAALAVPVAAQLLTVAAYRQDMTAVGLLMSCAVMVVGCVAGPAADRLSSAAA
jgi:hypothetical protein